MNRLWAVCCAFVTILGQVAAMAEENEPAKNVPELQALQHYAGTWDVVLTGDGSGKGEVTAKWILGGRFLEQSGVLHSSDGPDVWVTTLFTFDTQKAKYRSWTFVSNGAISQAEMTWDAKSKTMTSVSQPDMNGIRATNTADFSTTGKEHWHFRYADHDGKQVGEMSGVNTLRKVVDAKPAVASNAKPGIERSPEDKQLDRFLGTWKTEYRVPKAEWTPEEKRGSAEMIFSLELGGKMVRERTKHADGVENTFLMVFDASKKQYRAWWFSSTGQFNDSTGQWDEAAKAFTWMVFEPELSSTAQHRFVNDKLDWTVLVWNRQKVMVFLMEGTSARAKDAK